MAATFLLTTWLTPIARILALRWGVVDTPNGARKRHERVTPLLGGLAIVFGFVFPLVVVLCTTTHFTEGMITFHHFFGYIAGVMLLTIGGIIDDKWTLHAKHSLVIFIVAAGAAVSGGMAVSQVTNPFGGVIILTPILASIVAGLWILSMTMTTKILDGVDGLATSVTMIAALMIAALSFTEKYFQPDVALLALMFVGALLGFLLWNWHPAQIFLGEVGSTVLGFTIGVLSVIAGSKLATALLVLAIPALDVFLVVWRRYRLGYNPFTTSDRRHLHLLLIDAGMSVERVVTFYVSLALLFGITALIFTSWQKIFVLFALTIVAGGSILKIDDSRRF